MKARADFEQAAHAAVDIDLRRGRLGDAAEHFEQRAFAGAVAADDADDFAFCDLEVHIAQRPESLGGLAAKGWRSRASAVSASVECCSSLCAMV